MIKEGARVYEYIGNNWSQLGDDMVGETTFDSFGNSVSYLLTEQD